MKRAVVRAGLPFAFALALSQAQAASLQEAVKALHTADTKSLEFAGSGHWYQFGQAPSPTLPWPQFDVSAYVADINYDTASARVQSTRKQVVEPGRLRPSPVEQKVDAYISKDKAWNVGTPPNSLPGAAPAATVQPAAVEERAAEIWSTPQGFLKAAIAHNATSTPTADGAEIAFVVGGKYKFIGTLNSNNQLTHIRTWIDNPVLGDTLVETTFDNYKDFGGVQFPAHILRVEGGYPVLDLNISSAKLNVPVDITIPQNIAEFKASAPIVTVDKLADGVFYLRGGTHHSVAVVQGDHVVLVEAPLDEARSLALIDKIHELIPNKPIKYVINSHIHFDHTGGLRTLVNAGAIVVAPEADKTYLEKAWAAPHSLHPDLLSESQKPAKFETYTEKYVLSDGPRKIEIDHVAGNGHADELSLIYLPAEKILIEADAYTPAAPNAPRPAAPNPYSVNLYENIEKLKLDVSQIAALHGPGVVKLADLRAAIGLVTQ